MSKNEAFFLKIEPRMSVDAQNGGLEAQNGTKDQWSQIPIILMRSRIRIRIKVKSLIRAYPH
jgi:hypothetical protein